MEFQQLRENNLRLNQKCREHEATIEKLRQSKKSLKATTQQTQAALSALQADYETMKFVDEQKIQEMGMELRRQHQQFIEIFEAKEQQIVFEQQKAMEFSINVSDKESMIRCYDQQTLELQMQIDRLND